MRAHIRNSMLLALGLLVLWGVALSVVALQGKRDGLAAPSAAIIAAGVAGLVTISATSTWQEERRKHLENAMREQRQNAYAQVARHLMSQFTNGQLTDQAATRASIVTWASPGVASAFGEWNATFDRFSAENLPNGENQYSVPDHWQPILRRDIARVVTAMQNELNPGQPASEEAIERAMFNLK